MVPSAGQIGNCSPRDLLCLLQHYIVSLHNVALLLFQASFTAALARERPRDSRERRLG